MNRKTLAEAVAVANGLPEKQALEVLDTVLVKIADALAAGEKVQLHGFGTFESRERSSRVGVNPKTGEKLEISAARVPKFRAGKRLKDAINV